MINKTGVSYGERCRGWSPKKLWENPSPTIRHYSHVLLAIVFFLVAQLLKCAWDQPFWTYNIEFPGQILAMVFVWLFLWAVQLAFFRPGEGLESIYYRYLRAPVSLDMSMPALPRRTRILLTDARWYRPRSLTSTCQLASRFHS